MAAWPQKRTWREWEKPQRQQRDLKTGKTRQNKRPNQYHFTCNSEHAESRILKQPQEIPGPDHPLRPHVSPTQCCCRSPLQPSLLPVPGEMPPVRGRAAVLSGCFSSSRGSRWQGGGQRGGQGGGQSSCPQGTPPLKVFWPGGLASC